MFPKINKSLLVVFIIIIALAFRLPDLSEKPMHGDEAVNAVKYSQFLESGKFDYDPTEYHGPSLYYFTLPASWFSGNNTLKELTETTVRSVPVVFGLGLVLLLFILKAGVQWYILCIAAFVSAISPAFVYYSRYYIHEILLVFFCYLLIFSGYRYCLKQSFPMALLAGLSLGLLISTKETWIILVFMMILSLVLTFIPCKEQRAILLNFFKSVPLKHLIGFLIVLFFTTLSLYSSFFQNPQGIKNGLLAYSSYIDRAASNDFHIHPWYMYFNWLLFFSGIDGSFWSEGIIAFFAILGVIGVLIRKHFSTGENTFLYFIAIFVLSTAIGYSIIPYKTPWNLLAFWFGFILIGAAGFIYILNKLNQRNYKIIILLISLSAIIHLGWQSYELSYPKSSAIDNPYVYAHPVNDVFKITEQLENLALNHHDGYNLYIQVIAENNDYWPLPWYLRKFNRIGWWDRVDLETPAAPVMIIKPELEEQLIYKLYQLPPPGQRNLYLSLFDVYTELRPGIELRGYIRKDVWDKLIYENEKKPDFENE